MKINKYQSFKHLYCEWRTGNKCLSRFLKRRISITSPILTFKEIESWRSCRVVFHTCEGLHKNIIHETEGLKAWFWIPQSHYTHWIPLPYGCKTTTAHLPSQHTLGSIQYEHAVRFFKQHYEKTKYKYSSKADFVYCMYKNILFTITETQTL